jgi:hypothetical protein
MNSHQSLVNSIYVVIGVNEHDVSLGLELDLGEFRKGLKSI